VVPVLGALTAFAGPQPQDVALAVHADADDHVDRPVGDLALADLDVDGVDEQERWDCFFEFGTRVTVSLWESPSWPRVGARRAAVAQSPDLGE